MATTLIDGWISWPLTRDAEGYRTYKITFLAEASDPGNDGPLTALRTPGLPVVGSPYAFGNDFDPWAWCRPDAQVKEYYGGGSAQGEKNRFWTIEFTYSNKPLSKDQQRCHDRDVEDPLLEPQKLSGDFAKFQEEATHDRFGLPILTSSHEVIRGPQVEFDKNRHKIKVQQNVPLLGIETFGPMVDSVNQYVLWGWAPRTIKLTNASWEEKYYGLCYRYYTRTFEFEINRKGWDRDLLDEGTKVLNGHWGDGAEEGSAWVLDKVGDQSPDADNPSHFIRAKDRHGENITVILDGRGKPATQQAFEIVDIANSGSEDYVVETRTAHGLSVGDEVVIVGAEPSLYYDGEYTVGATISATEFIVPRDLDDPAPWTGGGHVYLKDAAAPGNIHVEHYPESDFLRLGIPVVIGP